ncbi:YfcC family protein [Geomicrobium sp. JCM 19039]|uniref:YfcC family protein n=1 Tax=Geomicrobium sp. JCM 19039 TaxID=1460636 RepID=UPI00045F1766|nr:AbgT family transporter [Geomicrobium sp. JCM 19039]GAK14191.1 arginine/ornithine antiporter ArcD [Geomicrobium sp. JCM 19039]
MSEQKNNRGMNVFALIFGVIIFATILTYLIPAGSYERVEQDGREVVDPGSYTEVESNPVHPFQIFTSIHTGLVEASDIIFFILIIGGTFGILNRTGAIDRLVTVASFRLVNQEKWFIPITMLIFALGGTLMGLAEETLAYIPILIPLALALRFDAITGTAIVLIGSSIGFTTAIMNPFNVGVAQGIAELDIYSGMWLRLILFILMYTIAVIFVYRYAMKVKRNPELGYYGNYAGNTELGEMKTEKSLTGTHKVVLGLFGVNFIVLAFGVIQFEWFITEIASLFLLLGVIIGIVARLGVHNVVDSFLKGASGVLAGALIVGFARAILVVLEDGNTIDTMLYYAVGFLENIPAELNAVGMIFIQGAINFFIPSGSGQAALTMPIMIPLADLLGITRQTTVLAFTLADGIGNIILPTSGYFMAALALAGIPWTKWVRFIWPFILIQLTIAVIAVMFAAWFGYGPF